MMKSFAMGGIHPKDNKQAANQPVEVLEPSGTVHISMSQHLGAPAEPVVQPGDKVLVGQVIGKPSGFMSAYVHSSVSGVVKAVAPMADLSGNLVTHVSIDVDGDQWEKGIDRTPEVVRDVTQSAATIIEAIQKAGVVGLGGAAFPTHIKLSPPPGKTADTLILNGTECEPYLTSDDRIMRERPAEIMQGAVLLMKALGVFKCYIGIEENKKEAIEIMKDAAYDSNMGIKIVVLRKKYPQGGEKQLIDAILKRRVPSKGLPIDVGAVVQNVGTALAVYEAVQKHKPLIDNVVTVTGNCFEKSRNFKVRIGTPFSKIIEAAGALPDEKYKVISGGPMMGRAVSNLEATTQKATSSILILTAAETLRKQHFPCIRCGKCAAACPMGLQPFRLYTLSKSNVDYDELERLHIYDCIECGCCLYTCPSNLPLLDAIRVSKAEVMKIIRSRK